MATEHFEIIDFHSHDIAPDWQLPETPGNNDQQRALWRTIHARISDEQALLEAIESGDIAGRVVNTPTALLARELSAFEYSRINDQLGELAARHAGRIFGLACVDAFAGEPSARELERAVNELGLRGVFVDCAKGDKFLDAAEARPLLEAAAKLGVPLFAHPINPHPLTAQMAPYGRLGTLLARGTANAASLVALVDKGVFEELPNLKIAVTALAVSGLSLTHAFGGTFVGRPDDKPLLRKHVYVDTMGFDPALICTLADIVGVDNLLAGSDWPIVSDGPIRDAAEAAYISAGFEAADRRKIGSLNVKRLLGLTAAA